MMSYMPCSSEMLRKETCLSGVHLLPYNLPLLSLQTMHTLEATTKSGCCCYTFELAVMHVWHPDFQFATPQCSVLCASKILPRIVTPGCTHVRAPSCMCLALECIHALLFGDDVWQTGHLNRMIKHHIHLSHVLHTYIVRLL